MACHAVSTARAGEGEASRTVSLSLRDRSRDGGVDQQLREAEVIIDRVGVAATGDRADGGPPSRCCRPCPRHCHRPEPPAERL